MKSFEETYALLNDEQKVAVRTTDGPLFVLAGPGTGKTQLLSARIANILKTTDTLPSNILALTFTESGALNMRERLTSMIGNDAYDVHISTYHSFGSEIIKRYPEFFQSIHLDRDDDSRMERPIDELEQMQIVSEIISKLPYDNPMLSARYYLKNLVSTIGELKGHQLSPDSLRELGKENIRQITSAQPAINKIVNDKNGISRKKQEAFTRYAQLLESFTSLDGELIDDATTELSEAYLEAQTANSTKALTAWRNKWLCKDESDDFTFTEVRRSEKMLALADVYETYQSTLVSKGLYDFDDMITRATQAIAENDELRFNLQEKYQYILLDEFQDTNAAQFALVELIASHPVNEGRPNIMAVGDDDQAIFAFQGAKVSNMNKFLKTFNDVKIVNLKKNYRSHKDILHVAHNVSSQIENRLHDRIEGVEKVLESASDELPKDASIVRHEFGSKASEYDWVATQAKKLIDAGTMPSEIAVLSPRHKHLETLVPFFNSKDIPVVYEKRENILDTKLVQSLKLMSELVVALTGKNTALVNQLFPEVLSLEFWQIPVEEIWKVNWQHYKREEMRTWAEIALENDKLNSHVLFFLALSTQSKLTPLEYTLDALSGVVAVDIGDGRKLFSPLKEYYFSEEVAETSPLEYFEAISHLSVIRSKLRTRQQSSEDKLTLEDFLNLFESYEAAETSLVNSHPIAQAESAVELMTVFKAKGLEFEHVFILSAHDDIWGSKAKSNNNKLSLPPNLDKIRYVGGDEDELRRLLYVAITRAKKGLYITSHSIKDSGKINEPVKYLSESDGISAVLPEGKQEVGYIKTDKKDLAAQVEVLWQSRHLNFDTSLKSLLQDSLANYQMSPTHLGSYVDMKYGGPEAFIMNTLLRFPKAPTVSSEFGTAIHNTLEWYQNQINSGAKPVVKDALKFYEKELTLRYISKTDTPEVKDKGLNALKLYLKQRSEVFSKPAKTEVNFYSEGVLIGDAHLSGIIDRLEVDDKNKTVEIVDYKTGAPSKKWHSDIKLLKYEQQLYFYKLLIEGSSTYKNYKVISARLDFVEPSKSGNQIFDPLYIEFTKEKQTQLEDLIQKVWCRVQTLDNPDTSHYSKDISGTKQFIKDLLK